MQDLFIKIKNFLKDLKKLTDLPLTKIVKLPKLENNS